MSWFMVKELGNRKNDFLKMKIR